MSCAARTGDTDLTEPTAQPLSSQPAAAVPAPPAPAMSGLDAPAGVLSAATALATAPLGDRAARGIAWMVFQSFGSKLISLFGQVALAWLLGRKEFGQVALAYAIFGFASVLQQSGLREILVQRYQHFRRWENAAFWMSLVGGFLSAGFMIAVAPAASAIFKSPGLLGLMAVLALTGPISALAVVPMARLQIELRFRLLSVITIICSIVTVVLNVLFAYSGFGAYSFILPLPIVAALRTLILIAADPPRVRPRLHLRRWRYLLGDSGLAVATVLCIILSTQGDYLLLGYRHGEEQVGLYFFAFTLSAQTMQLLAGNIAGVLFPTLTKLQHDPQRQCQAFTRASRLAALVGVPFCFLQAALAAPVFALLFDSKWQPSVPIFQALSLGMASLMSSIAAGSMMQAQGRFNLLFYVSLGFAIFFVSLVGVATWLGQAFAVAVAVAIYATITGPLNVYFAIRLVGGGWRQVWEIYAVPYLAAALATGLPFLLVHSLVAQRLPAWGANGIQIILIGLLAVILYLPLVRCLAPTDWRELLDRARSFLRPRQTTS